MKISVSKIFLFFFLFMYSLTAYTQDFPNTAFNIDSVKKIISTQKEDTNKVNTLNILCWGLIRIDDYKNSMQRAKEALALSEKLFFKRGEADAYINIARAYGKLNNSSEGLKNNYAALKIYQGIGDKYNIARSFQFIGAVYTDEGNDLEALNSYNASLKIRKEIGDKKGIGQSYNSIGQIYSSQGKYVEALEKHFAALKLFQEAGMPDWGLPFTYESISYCYEMQGNAFFVKGDKLHALNKYSEALKNALLCLKSWQHLGWLSSISDSYLSIANLNIKLNQFSEASQNLQKGFQIAKELNAKTSLSTSYNILFTLDSIQGNYRHAFKHYKLYRLYQDSLNNAETAKKFLQTRMQHNYDIKAAAAKAVQDKKDDAARRTRNLQYFVIGAFLLIAVFLYINSRQKQKAKLKIQRAYSELKSAQAQLIQSEKMASLGELTAGIAHEIQNPLNFVNNFSELNKELIGELREENTNSQTRNEILNDIEQNLEKVLHHGKRADAIVKNMLQHSRNTSSQKEPTNINALTDEYLRLSYHGLRAKDKSFNATLNTDFDETIGKINIIPQEIGRVLLNLYNNAFYAVTEKKKQQSGSYEPTILVSTKKINSKIEIRVKDNGNGIPQKVLDKIFQPFFTTKPTGQGTGLGLSLSYDIIKAHGGEIKVETKKGEGAEFVIQLPLNKAS